MTTLQSTDFFVGLLALTLLLVIGWRIWRGLRDGRLAVRGWISVGVGLATLAAPAGGTAPAVPRARR